MAPVFLPPTGGSISATRRKTETNGVYLASTGPVGTLPTVVIRKKRMIARSRRNLQVFQDVVNLHRITTRQTLGFALIICLQRKSQIPVSTDPACAGGQR